MKIGILPFARPTFDVPLAEAKLAAMMTALEEMGHKIVGPSVLLMDSQAGREAISRLHEAGIDQLLILQVTFTDASMIGEAIAALEAPLSIWAIPEPRDGGRLRLNSFCGLNLASHALGLRHRPFSWLFADPETVSDEELAALFDGSKCTVELVADASNISPTDTARSIVARIQGKRIARIGVCPEGFDTCAYDPDAISKLAGVTVDELELQQLFEQAMRASPCEVVHLRQTVADALPDLDNVDQHQLDKSLRLKVALDALRTNGNYQAFALRCWPETFTEFGGAVCGPASMLGDSWVPCACEADVYGALTQLILQEASSSAVFLTDLVDLDIADDTGVVWHCGQAPLSMCDPEAEASATIHTNRKMPLLYEFPLKAGRVTLMRISQSLGQTKMILTGGEMLARPMSFTGTSGVLKFNRSIVEVLPDIMNSGIEHHMALTYGDHRQILREIAATMQLPLLEI